MEQNHLLPDDVRQDNWRGQFARQAYDNSWRSVVDFDPVASAKHILTAYLGGSLTIKETERSLRVTRSSFNLPHTMADIIDQMDILVGLVETRSDKEMDLLENALRSQIRLILK